MKSSLKIEITSQSKPKKITFKTIKRILKSNNRFNNNLIIQTRLIKLSVRFHKIKVVCNK